MNGSKFVYKLVRYGRSTKNPCTYIHELSAWFTSKDAERITKQSKAHNKDVAKDHYDRARRTEIEI